MSALPNPNIPFPPSPVTYFITDGQTTAATDEGSAEFERLVEFVRSAMAAGVRMVQLREKRLRPRVLCALTRRAAVLMRGTPTRLFVNDRADIARAAGADGVHLAHDSLDAAIVRRHFGADFLIGVSTHTLAEAQAARDAGANFVVFGPIFDTPSKRAYGAPVGLSELGRVVRLLAPFPVIALGGVTLANAAQAIHTGASGVAGIRLFVNAADMRAVVRTVEGSTND